MALSDILAEALPRLDELSEALQRYARHPHYAEIRVPSNRRCPMPKRSL
jgi:hypothetical protein